ncbi:MAG: SRPBCC domain-containing protein [Rhizobiaceae bacterium]|nr:SRPBCC domain-containing protein [Rhizobiaceae bacterium]
MTDAAFKIETRDIVVDEVFPHSAEVVWRALTDGRLMSRWMMEPTGFEAVVGNRFTFKTKPAGAWDGTIRCEVLVVRPMECFAYAWRGGDSGNVGYGSLLDTVVTWTLSPAAGGTRVRVVHSGFVTPKNDTAFENMSQGWKAVVPRLIDTIGTLH